MANWLFGGRETQQGTVTARCQFEQGIIRLDWSPERSTGRSWYWCALIEDKESWS